MSAKTKITWNEVAAQIMAGETAGRDVALAALESDDSDILTVIDAAFQIRRQYFGKTVKLNYLVNAQSGACPEDCGYCSQSSVATSDIDRYAMLSHDEIVAAAERAVSLRASTCCIVASGREAVPSKVERVANAAREIKRRHPGLRICACMGLLDTKQANALGNAGIDRYNHNLNTSQNHYPSICSTHTYDDRVKTVETAALAGLSPCSGMIVGMGENHNDLIDTALALRELDADSIPMNFLVSIQGTPLADTEAVALSPRFCLKVLCMLRFLCPTKEIRVSAGREQHLRTLQPLSLYPANAIFVSDYLTTKGQSPTLDWQIIEDLGFEIETVESPTAPAPCPSASEPQPHG